MSKSSVIKILGFALLIAGGLSLILFWVEPAGLPGSTEKRTVSSTILRNIVAREVPAGWREYQNTKYRLSLLYPQELTVNELPEGGGASTVTFQSVKQGKGFQIFIVPYGEQQISDERFKEDVPSGVRTNITDVVIDGATGASFYSRDVFLGDTAEVWFIKDGFLYEVTTIRSLDQWLSTIMTTWLFLPPQ